MRAGVMEKGFGGGEEKRKAFGGGLELRTEKRVLAGSWARGAIRG